METVWVCKHVLSGDNPKRITNLDGFVYIDCGKKEHFDNLRHQSTTTPVHLHHFGKEIPSIANTLPICCAANQTGGKWSLERFVDEHCEYTGYCNLAVPAEDYFPDLLGKELYVFVSPHGYPAVVNGAHGLRSVPIMVGLGNANKAKAQWFPEDHIELLTYKRTLELISEMAENSINFFNIDFGINKWDEVILAKEVRETLEN